MSVPYAEVIGDPIAHSKSPQIHNLWLNRLGIKGEYRLTRLSADELPTFLDGRRGDPDWRGCNVTMPLKEAAPHLVERMSSAAAGTGAVNVITPTQSGLVGGNTDVDGVVALLPGPLSGRRACIIGAGGAARSAIYALASHSVHDIRIIVRRPELARDRLRNLSSGLAIFGEADASLAMTGAEIIVQASSGGMAGHAPLSRPVLEALDQAHPDASAVEMVYHPLETPFLRRTGELNFLISDGLDMLISQAAEAFRLFFGAAAPDRHYRDLRALLTS